MAEGHPNNVPIEEEQPNGRTQNAENPPSPSGISSPKPYEPGGGGQAPPTYVVQPNPLDPKIADAIASTIKEIPALIKERMNTKKDTDRSVTVSVLWWSGTLVVGIVVVVGILTWAGKMSADATSFLLGVLVGTAFSFVRDFFPNSR